jgi:hypothetical protein
MNSESQHPRSPRLEVTIRHAVAKNGALSDPSSQRVVDDAHNWSKKFLDLLQDKSVLQLTSEECESKAHAKLIEQVEHCSVKAILARIKLMLAEDSVTSLKTEQIKSATKAIDLDRVKTMAVALENFKEAQRIVRESKVLEERRRLCNSSIITAAKDKVTGLVESAKENDLQLQEKHVALTKLLEEEAKARRLGSIATKQRLDGYTEVFGAADRPQPSKNTTLACEDVASPPSSPESTIQAMACALLDKELDRLKRNWEEVEIS